MNFGLFFLVALLASAVYQLSFLMLLKMMGDDAGLLGALFFVLAIVLPFGLLMALGRYLGTWGGGPDRTQGLWLAILVNIAATFLGILFAIIVWIMRLGM